MIRKDEKTAVIEANRTHATDTLNKQDFIISLVYLEGSIS